MACGDRYHQSRDMLIQMGYVIVHILTCPAGSNKVPGCTVFSHLDESHGPGQPHQEAVAVLKFVTLR